MKKRSKGKTAKANQTDMPELVTAMTKLVERLEALEKKTDLVISRVASLPQEMRRACQDVRRSEPSHQVQPFQGAGQGSPQNHGGRERPLYQAVCADCRKNCEVPFKPTGERPVYCKECFARRKSGNVPKALGGPTPAPEQPRKATAAPQGSGASIARGTSKIPKTKPSKKKKKKG